MIHAPVGIVTLNRYSHFRKCLESLEKCTGADETEVFVALDYPPSEKYKEGWTDIDEYLKIKEADNGFKQLNVVRRKYNCGVGKPNGNWELLEQYLHEHYDRYIFTEDDNVFSPNFLEFINKGLEKYENTPSVSAVVGYCLPFPFKTGNDNYFMHNTDFSAWGYGTWFNMRHKITEDIRCERLKKTFNLKNYLKVRKQGFNRLLNYMAIVLKPKGEYIWITDSVLSVYNIVNDMYVIVPTLSKVRNMGWDMTGCSFSGKNGKDRLKKYGDIAERHIQQWIDTEPFFDFKGNGTDYTNFNNQVAVAHNENKISYIVFLKKLFFMLIKAIAKQVGLKKIKNIIRGKSKML